MQVDDRFPATDTRIEDSAGVTTIRVCNCRTCGALVRDVDRLQHHQWHAMLETALDLLDQTSTLTQNVGKLLTSY